MNGAAQNYYKLVGFCLGRVGDCFPFDVNTEREAYAAAVERRQSLSRAQSRVGIAVYRRTALHPECLSVGECPEDVGLHGVLS